MAGSTKLMTAGGGGVILTPASSVSSDVIVSVPSVNGTLLTNKTAGTVLQVVSATYSTDTATTSATYVDTGITATITPTSASSKIIVLISNPIYIYKNGTTYVEGSFQLLRNGSSIFTNSGSPMYMTTAASGNLELNSVYSLNYLDSPASTSAVTYKLQQKTANGTVGSAANNMTASITLMEIAA